MAKYTNMAGFKGVTEEDAEETSEKLPRPLFFLIIGGVAVVIIVAFLIVHPFPPITEVQPRRMKLRQLQ